MLGRRTDMWCTHDDDIDFDFVNARYRCAIVGGAGLLHMVFEPFWRKLRDRCRIPMIIHGVGGCFPDGTPRAGVDQAIVAEVAGRCDLVNIRDDATAEHYALTNAHISACPTIAYLQRFERSVRRTDYTVLLCSHPQLVCPRENRELERAIRRATGRFRHTDNIQRRYLGLDDIVSRLYCRTRLVVTSRLHGAIIAYGLGIPYIAIARDEKIRSFCRRYGNGITVAGASELESTLRMARIEAHEPIAIRPVLEFGSRARAWADELCPDDRELAPVAH